jgi:hypothetical protein
MKNFVKYAAVGLAGYFIGFYEMKYKTLKTLMQVYAERKSDGSN